MYESFHYLCTIGVNDVQLSLSERYSYLCPVGPTFFLQLSEALSMRCDYAMEIRKKYLCSGNLSILGIDNFPLAGGLNIYWLSLSIL